MCFCWCWGCWRCWWCWRRYIWKGWISKKNLEKNIESKKKIFGTKNDLKILKTKSNSPSRDRRWCFTIMLIQRIFYCHPVSNICYCTQFCACNLVCARGTRYCWAWGKDSFETNKWTTFLETEVTFPYCNWSIKMARSIGFGSTSVVNSWQRLGRLPFWVYVEVGNYFKQKRIL